MNITRITTHAERCFNHPFEQYSNLRPSVTLEATLAPGDDPLEAAKALQAQAETLVEDHKRSMLESIHQLERLTRAQSEVRQLGDEIRRAQLRLANLRKDQPDLALPDFGTPVDEETFGN